MDDNKLKSDYEYSENRMHIISVQENERKRIARDLHDTVLQNLTHILHQVELSQMYMERDTVKAKLELLSAQQNTKNAIEEIRNIVFDLRPMSFDDLGFKETFDNFYDLIKRYSDFEVVFDVDDITGKSEYYLLTVYRIAREALMNALRHSGGNKIVFRCKNDGKRILLTVEDNGKGFDSSKLKEKNHYGLAVIRERVGLLEGTFQIVSDNGTKVIVDVPL